MPDAAVRNLVDRMHERGGFVTLRDVGDVQKPYEINIALFSALGEDVEALIGAHTLLLSLQGVPAIYIQSLLARGNDLDRVEQTGRTRSINRSQFRYQELTAQLQEENSASRRMIEALQHVSAVRRTEKALHETATQEVLPAPPSAVALWRGDADRVLVVASVRDGPIEVDLGAVGVAPGLYRELLGDDSIEVASTITLRPWQVVWLKAE